jgi:hypothetical protein
MSDLTKAIEDFVSVFESLSIPYALMGGIAVRVYGIPRATYDVDFTAAIPRDRLPDVFQKVQALGYSVPEAYVGGWVNQVGGMPLVKFRLFLDGRGVDVDVFLAESDYQDALLGRRRFTALNGIQAWLVSPEDLILLKLIANRPRDRADVGDVLFMQGQLDLAYLRHWAGRLEVADRLEATIHGFYPEP